VGTKLKIAFATGRHDTVGQDLVNHCVNDIAVLGAEPLFFLDYIGTGKLKPHVFHQLISGFSRACQENRCALIGGETAQMPGFYRPGEYDVCGTIVGIVEKSKMLDGSGIRPGDVLVGLASSGLHTNGYSLARKIIFQKLKWKPETYAHELGATVADELLKVHVSYGPLVQRLLQKFNTSGTAIKGLAHITGGGFIDNIPRVLPAKCDAVVRRGTWPVPPIFPLLAKAGRVPDEEMHQVFNMGIGMVIVVAAEKAAAALTFVQAQKHSAWIIGEIVKGRGQTKLA
jgi:phosphoribosylformylglycinamidine cyclo-ligase